MSLTHIAILLVGGIISGLVDAIIGGGGLFSVPSLLLTGFSLQETLGTNQLSMSFGSLVATLKFNQKGNIKWWPETIICLIGALPGTVLGGLTAISIPPQILHTVVIILLALVGIVVVMKKNGGTGNQDISSSVSLFKATLIFFLGVAIGFYEGFFGPGSGIIVGFVFVTLLGFSYVKASGAAKVVSLAGNIAAFITYGWHGDVHWIAGFIMAFSVSIGAYIGSFFAQRRGGKVIRPVMLGVVVLLVVNALTSSFHTFNFL